MVVTKDFKMVIVVNDELPVGLKTNTAAVLSLTLGNKIEGLIGTDLTDKSGNVHTALTTIPLPILKSSSEQLKKLYTQSYNFKDSLLLVDITHAAQSTKNYKDYEEKLSQTYEDDLKLLGLALAGSEKSIKQLTGSLPLLR